MIVALNSDSSVKRLKGASRPIISLNHRVVVLRELRCLSAVTVFYQDTPEQVIRLLKPEVLAKASDYRKEEIVGAAFVESYGGRVFVPPLVTGWSTTKLIERLKEL